MNPLGMALIIVTLNAVFAVSAWRRFNLLKVGAPTWESRLGELPKRLGLVWTFAFYQKKMRYYLAAGLAHQLIFLGFVVLLLNTLMLWGRGVLSAVQPVHPGAGAVPRPAARRGLRLFQGRVCDARARGRGGVRFTTARFARRSA